MRLTRLKEDRMAATPMTSRIRYRGLRSLCALGVGILWTGVFAGPSAADPPAEKAEPNVERKVPRKVVKQPRATRSGVTPRSARHTPFQMDSGAKWSCAQQAMTVEPTWRGAKAVTFSFDIRNEGTADLKIKARGG